jgi:hypothetical protein
MDFDLIPTHERRSNRVKMDYAFSKSDAPPSMQGRFQERYQLRCTVQTVFWATSDELARKKQDAIVMARSHLFRDMIPLVNEIITDTGEEDVRISALKLLDIMRGK